MKSLISKMLLISYMLISSMNAEDINNVRQKLIEITREILQTEHHIIETDNNTEALLEKERKALSKIFQQKNIGHTLQNLRHVQGASSLLMAITSDSVDDFVKSVILLQIIEPQLDIKYKDLLSHLTLIASSRTQIKENSNKVNENKEKLQQLANQQENLLNQKYHLFFKTSHNPNLEKFAKDQSTNSSSTQQLEHFDDLVHQLQTLFLSEPIKSNNRLTLMIPVNGTINSNSPPDSSTQGAEQDLSICFETGPNAQVISPIGGSVVFAGFIPSFGQVVILKQDDFFCVMTGLGAIHCFLGDTLLPAEPIGRMPSEGESVKHFKLHMELHKGGQHLDPRPYLNIKT